MITATFIIGAWLAFAEIGKPQWLGGILMLAAVAVRIWWWPA